MNHREVLGVGNNATQAEIKKAFREAAKELHPDHNDSPEAAEAFRRIKEAHDALIKSADRPRESSATSAAAARAAAATAQAAYTAYQQQTQKQQMSDEELKRIQDLDEKAQKAAKKRGLFRRAKESAELRRHRKKIKTNNDRLSGIY